jgi:protein TonB
MELKKNPKYDLARKAGMFRNLGLTISLSLVIIAFEWPANGDQEIIELGEVKDNFEEIMDMPPTEQPPPPPPTTTIAEIKEVANDVEIEDELEVEIDLEITEDTSVEEIVFTESEPEPIEEKAEEIFTIVEEKPEFPGGIQAFYQYVSDELKYPARALRMQIQGRVFVQFVVEKDGSVGQVQVVKGIGAGCDEEALRVMRAVPKFNPGKQRGRPVRVRMVLPINFKLAQ